MVLARAGELGNLPGQIARFCRKVLRKDYLPRLSELMPSLADRFVIVGGSEQTHFGLSRVKLVCESWGLQQQASHDCKIDD